MPLRIGPLWALLIGFVVLMASNSRLKGIFGYGEIATDVPFLLTDLVLFAIWKFNRRGQARNTLMGSARFGDGRDLAKMEGSGVARYCGSAWKRDTDSGVIGVEKGALTQF